MYIILPTNINIISNFDKVLEQIKEAKHDEDVKFSFENIGFIAPDNTIMLIALSKQAYDITGKPVVWKRIKDEVRSYMNRIDIGKLDFIELPYRFSMRRRLHTNNLIELKVINEPQDIEIVLSRVKEVLDTWYGERMATEYSLRIQDFIREIAANSLEHSQKDGKGICYFTLQKYESNDKEISIKMAFGDTGMGIRQSLDRKYAGNEYKSPIEQAFINGWSCRINNDGGLGFRTVKRLLHTHGGTIHIRTGNAELMYNGEKNYFKKKEYKESLLGTQTAFVLK